MIIEPANTSTDALVEALQITLDAHREAGRYQEAAACYRRLGQLLGFLPLEKRP